MSKLFHQVAYLPYFYHGNEIYNAHCYTEMKNTDISVLMSQIKNVKGKLGRERHSGASLVLTFQKHNDDLAATHIDRKDRFSAS